MSQKQLFALFQQGKQLKQKQNNISILNEVIIMKEEYNFENAIKNPYTKNLKKQ